MQISYTASKRLNNAAQRFCAQKANESRSLSLGARLHPDAGGSLGARSACSLPGRGAPPLSSAESPGNQRLSARTDEHLHFLNPHRKEHGGRMGEEQRWNDFQVCSMNMYFQPTFPSLLNEYYYPLPLVLNFTLGLHLSLIQSMSVGCLLCAKHPYGCWRHNNEEFRQVLCPEEIIFWKKQTVNKLISYCVRCYGNT